MVCKMCATNWQLKADKGNFFTVSEDHLLVTWQPILVPGSIQWNKWGVNYVKLVYHDESCHESPQCNVDVVYANEFNKMWKKYEA